MSGRPAIRLVVVDDQAEIRKAVTEVLDGEDTIVVVGQASNGEEALQVIADAAPDLVLMDLRMPVMDGVQATRRLSRSDPGVPVVVHTAYGDGGLVIEALTAGARGYLLKGSEPAMLIAAINSVAAGFTHIADEVTRPLVDRLIEVLASERQTRFAAEEAARRLEAVNARQREFAIMSSHELRTPLTLLLTSLDALGTLPLAAEADRLFLHRTAREGGQRLLRLVENLDIAVDIESLELTLESIDLSVLSPTIVAELIVAPKAVRTKVPRGLCAIGDRRRLRQVIDNLVSNALNASPSRDGVLIAARTVSGQVVIDISDKGHGFRSVPEFGSDETAGSVPFALRPDATGGLGLGLWVSDELVKAMGGRIAARNNRGRGATVSLYLLSAA